jgi:hypothetical protein
VYFEIEAAGTILHNGIPAHMETTITHKPPAPGETYENPFTISLINENNDETGIELLSEKHTPNTDTTTTIPPTSTRLNVGDQWANCGDVGVKIPICLINLDDEVGAVQIDLCEDINDCLICVGCEMTERTTIFDCMVNELENGCCAVVVFSKNPGGVINPGECDIVIIDYTLQDEEECCNNCINIVPVNIEVVDQYGYLVDTGVGDVGMVCPFECGDVEPAASTAASWDCGDGDVDIFDILEEVDFIIHVKTPDDCQAIRADVPTGTPPNCDPPDGAIDVGDLMVIIDMALNRQDCCSYYYGGVIY